MKNKTNHLLKKELTHSINRNKSQLIIITLMIFLTSFMYFFVQCSIDGNRRLITEEQEKFEIALNSNEILAGSFLAALIVVTAFILFMFYRNFFTLHKKEIGCLKALGISNARINRTCMLYTLRLSGLASLLGMAVGWYASDILNNAYVASYDITTVGKGIALTSFCYGVILVSGTMTLMPYVSGRKVLNKDTALLICNSDDKKENHLINTLSSRFAAIAPAKFRLPIRIALRKPLTVLLTMTAVMSAMTLFILSVSLNLSSQKIYRSQTQGHNYQWNTKYETYFAYQPEKSDNTQEIHYLQEEVNITAASYGAVIPQTIFGLEKYNDLFTLVGKKNKGLQLPVDNEIIISPELEEVYGIHIGDSIIVNYKDKPYQCLVTDIAINASLQCIYISIETLQEWIGEGSYMYNGLYSMNQPTVSGKSVSKIERLEKLDQAAVSNRTSAVINQALGGVIGCLLIYLVILLNFSDSMKEILTLHLLGYRAKQINTMLISIYRPLLWVAFFLMLYPSIYLCKSIQQNLSIQTNDYMPFQTNGIVILLIFIVINGIYALVKFIFERKVQKIIDREDVQEQLF